MLQGEPVGSWHIAPSWEMTSMSPWEQGLCVYVPIHTIPSPSLGQAMSAGTTWASAGCRSWQGCGSILHPWQGRAALGNPSPGLAGRKGGQPIPPCSGGGGGGGLISSADAILG